MAINEERVSTDVEAELLYEEGEAVQQRTGPSRRLVIGSIAAISLVVAVLAVASGAVPVAIQVGGHTITNSNGLKIENKGCWWEGNTYKCYESTTTGGGGAGACFPGQAEVQVQGRGNTAIGSLKVGDRVLVEAGKELVYEPVLSFIHSGRLGKESKFVNIEHESGKLRVSADHVLFVDSGSARIDKLAIDVQEGEKLVAVGGPSTVTSVSGDSNKLGMFAPLTPAGTIVVDGVVASNYATVASHAAAHAAFFPARIYNYLGFSWVPTDATKDEMHPLASLFHRKLKLDQLIVAS